jgi:hypothetical protein
MRLAVFTIVLMASCLGQNNPPTKAGAPIALWAAVGVTKPLFQLYEMQQMALSFIVVNDGTTTVNPRINSSRLLINGVEPKDWGIVIMNGLRTPDFESLAPGKILSFGYQLGPRYFSSPGTYSVRWEGENLKSAEVIFRVMPAQH